MSLFLVLQDYNSAGEVHFTAGDLLDDASQPILSLQTGGLAVIEFVPATMQGPLDLFLSYRNTRNDIGGEYLSSLLLEAGAFGAAGTPTGPAGGDLSGTYPNPRVQDLTISGELQGSMLYFDGTNWVQLQHGTPNQVLTTQGLTTPPIWRDLDTILPADLVTGFQTEGSGEAVTRTLVSNTLTFKSLVGGDGVSLSSDPNEVTISSDFDPAMLAFTRVLFADAGTPTPLAQQTGRIDQKFGTIEQAANAAPTGEVTAIIVSPGTYPEGFTVPGKCTLAITDKQIGLYSWGRWQLGTSAAKVDIDITATPQSSPLTAFSILAFENGTPGKGGVFSESLVPEIFGKLNYSLTGSQQLRGSFSCDIDGDASGVAIAAAAGSMLGMVFTRSRIGGDVIGDGIDIQDAQSTQFTGEVNIERLRRAIICQMEAHWTVTFAPPAGRVQGFINSHWDSGITFTGPVGSFVVDAYTNFYAVDNGVTLAGAATKVIIHDAGSGPGPFLPLAGDTMTGDILMDGNDVTGAGAVSATTFNGVPLTAAGIATNFLNEEGNYVAPAGGGDFTGPAGAVAGNLVSFADASGKLGVDSGVAASAVGPGGADTQIQFNDSGAFGASSSFTFDGSNLHINSDLTVGNTRLFVDISNGTTNIGKAVTGTDAFNVFGPGTGVQQGISSFYDSSSNIKFRLRDEWTVNSIPPRLETESTLGMAFNTTTNSKYIWYVNGTGNERMRLDATGLTVLNAIGAASFNGVPLTTAGATTNFLNEAGAYSVPPSEVPSARNLTAGAGLTGGGTLAADRAFDVVAHADGSMVINANDLQVGILATDAQHGARGGGTQHSDVVAAGASGFMTGADKTKLNGIAPGAEVNAVDSVFARTGAVVSADSDYDASQVDNDSSVTGAFVDDAFNTLWARSIVAGAGLTGGGDLAADRTFNVVANADGSMVINADDLQVGVLATDAQHGLRGGGTQHAVATGGANGFMSSTDKTAFDLGPFLPLTGGTMSGALLMGSNTIQSVSALGVGVATPVASALVELSSTTQGFLPPRMTTAQRDAIVSPATGLELYNTTTNEAQCFNGSIWATAGGDTTIYNGDGTIDTSAAQRVVTVDAGVSSSDGLLFNALSGGNDDIAEFFIGNQLIDARVTNDDGLTHTGFDVDTIDGIRIFDGTNEIGAFYHADYSTAGIATKGDRWIPDKGWVDTAVAAVGSPAQALTFGGGNVQASGTAPRYLAPGFDEGLVGTTELFVEDWPFAGSIDQLRGAWGAAAGSVNVVFVLRINGVDTALTFTALSDGASGDDLVNSVAVAAGDQVSFAVVKSAATGSAMIDLQVSMRVVAS